MLSDPEIREIFERRNAFIGGSHIVYTSGLHGREYIAKDDVTPHVNDLCVLCEVLADRTQYLAPEVVAVPTVGAIAISQWLTFHLMNITDREEIVAVYADKVSEEFVLQNEHKTLLELGKEVCRTRFHEKTAEHSEVIAKLERYLAVISERTKQIDTFEFKRGYDKRLKGKRVLVAEDVINTGGSVSQIIAAVRACEGIVVGVAGLANRGGITYKDLDVPELHTLLNVKMETWNEEECPMCREGIPINTDVGKGKEYLARKAREA